MDRQHLLFGFILTALVVGCSGSTGGQFGLLPDVNRLTPDAKEMRQVAWLDTPMPRELNKTTSPPYTVEPGDVLLIQPVNFDSPVRLPGDQPILPDGTIYLGQYGRLHVAGKPLEVIEREVQSIIDARTKEAGPVGVRLVSRQSKVFYVLGEVNAPGAFVLQGRETVLDALMIAGGLNDNANRDKIILTHPSAPEGCRTVMPVYYNDIVQLGDTTTNYQIAAGDRIFVPSRNFWESLSELCPKRSPRPQYPCTPEVGCLETPGVPVP